MEDLEREKFIKSLREKNKKVTPQRLAVFESLRTRKDHPNVEDIYQDVKLTYPTISLSTIYQILDLMLDLGRVTKIKTVNRDSRYETDTSPHINAICPICGEIEDYQTETINAFWNQIKKEFDFDPISKRIDVYRICNKCRKKKE